MTNKEWDKHARALRKIDKRVEQRVGEPCFVDYSAYDTDENGVPIDNLDGVAVSGKAIFVLPKDEFFGGDKSKDYKSPVVENPTWLDLCVLANEAIKTTNDHHHTYLESIRRTGDITDGVRHWEFSMGS